MAMNPEPNVDDSTVFCALLNHCIGDEFKCISIFVCDLRVNLFPA